jgi:hypothetical protein
LEDVEVPVAAEVEQDRLPVVLLYAEAASQRLVRELTLTVIDEEMSQSFPEYDEEVEVPVAINVAGCDAADMGIRVKGKVAAETRRVRHLLERTARALPMEAHRRVAGARDILVAVPNGHEVKVAVTVRVKPKRRPVIPGMREPERGCRLGELPESVVDVYLVHGTYAVRHEQIDVPVPVKVLRRDSCGEPGGAGESLNAALGSNLHKE